VLLFIDCSDDSISGRKFPRDQCLGIEISEKSCSGSHRGHLIRPGTSRRLAAEEQMRKHEMLRLRLQRRRTRPRRRQPIRHGAHHLPCATSALTNAAHPRSLSCRPAVRAGLVGDTDYHRTCFCSRHTSPKERQAHPET
jgi:hypothetical protein